MLRQRGVKVRDFEHNGKMKEKTPCAENSAETYWLMFEREKDACLFHG